jgi:putative spermidine/putrescine transport system substrate-binding protein
VKRRSKRHRPRADYRRTVSEHRSGPVGQVLPDHAAKFPSVLDNYLPAAPRCRISRKAGARRHVHAGRPAKAWRRSEPPTTPRELLAWCRRIGPFQLREASQLGTGLRSSWGFQPCSATESRDRSTAGKTWAYLKELDGCIEYYPSGTGAMMSSAKGHVT